LAKEALPRGATKGAEVPSAAQKQHFHFPEGYLQPAMANCLGLVVF